MRHARLPILAWADYVGSEMAVVNWAVAWHALHVELPRRRGSVAGLLCRWTRMTIPGSNKQT
jgi:hypothetical protein